MLRGTDSCFFAKLVSCLGPLILLIQKSKPTEEGLDIFHLRIASLALYLQMMAIHSIQRLETTRTNEVSMYLLLLRQLKFLCRNEKAGIFSILADQPRCGSVGLTLFKLKKEFG
jgi:hypothetical protein